jgi:membrane protein DedA with SNARE-associated domain/rhodanese-related sulfurtransferase
MSFLFDLIEQYGLLIVFANVFVEQLGAPIPAYPTLVITGAMLGRGELSAPLLLAVAIGSALLADTIWYEAGKRYGGRVMSTLCRISISPDTCVRQTASVYARWGAWSLLVAKFIPGFASLASALAGMVGTPRRTFILFDGLGAALWAGSAIGLGSLFSSGIDELLLALGELGKWGLLLVAVAFAVFIAKKLWQRHTLLRSLHMARVTVAELKELHDQGLTPTVLDVRTPLLQQQGRIPGAIAVPIEGMKGFVLEGRPDDEVIVYCACPNEISAAQLASQLRRQGFQRVRPLTGGIDAWIAAHRVEK